MSADQIRSCNDLLGSFCETDLRVGPWGNGARHGFGRIARQERIAFALALDTKRKAERKSGLGTAISLMSAFDPFGH